MAEATSLALKGVTTVWTDNRSRGGVSIRLMSRRPGQGHVEGPRDGRRRQGQDVDIGPEALDLLLVADAEPLLLVDDEKAEVAGKRRPWTGSGGCR